MGGVGMGEEMYFPSSFPGNLWKLFQFGYVNSITMKFISKERWGGGCEEILFKFHRRRRKL
jgi:hypothetical protein